MVDHELGARYFPGGDPLGRQFRVNVDEAVPVWLVALRRRPPPTVIASSETVLRGGSYLAVGWHLT